MGTQRVQMKGVLPWLVRWACHASTRDFCSALAALVGKILIFFFPHRIYYFNSFDTIAQQAGQVVVLLAYLLVCVHGVVIFGSGLGNCGKRLINGFFSRGNTVAGVGC